MNKTSLSEEYFIRKNLNILRKLNEETSNQNEVVIDKNDNHQQETVQNLNKFVGPVKIDDKAEIVYPADSDVVFNGAITDMNNLKFQFRYNDQSGGLYIWSESLLLTKETAEKLSKLVTVKEQWKEYWAENISQYQQ